MILSMSTSSVQNTEKKYPPVYKALKKYYGYDEFRPGQLDLIKALLDGRDVLGIMPTGAGKSVCFQIPAIFMEGITLVISPLISLMQDQVQALIQAHIPAAYLNSSLTLPQYRTALSRAKQGKYKIIYVAPERLNTPGFLDFANTVKISMIAVDEAHCVSQWGQNFRPSYLEIEKFAKTLKQRPIMAAFTATATGPVKDDMIQMLDLHDPEILITGFDRENLFFEVRKPADKFTALLNFLEEHPHESGIIYCQTRKETEEVCRKLNDQGYPCTRYHAGLDSDERTRNQQDFLYDRIGLICATNAFGMGIDKSNVRFVVHYSMPQSLENYYQEAGRAGRDGAPAHCLLLYSGSDIMTAKFLIEKSNEENEDQLKREMVRLNAMDAYCKTSMCLRSYILQYFGQASSGKCSGCSNCKSSWIEEDISTEALKIYEAIEELPRSYGLTTVLDFVKGKDTAKLRNNGYTGLDHYGALKKESSERIRMILESLLMQGYLEKSSDRYQVISPTATFDSAIQAQETILMRHKITPQDLLKAKKGKKGAKEVKEISVPRPTSISASALPQQSLLDKLRTVRTHQARKFNLPPYLIFSDATLMAMAEKKPKTKEELLSLPGVGQYKCDQYGAAFLTAIKADLEQRKEKADPKKRRLYSLYESILNNRFSYDREASGHAIHSQTPPTDEKQSI